MSDLDPNQIIFPDEDFQNLATDLSLYVNQLSEEESSSLGDFFIDYSQEMEPNGSPLAEFTQESFRWLGQSIKERDFDVDEFNLSPAATAAAVVEFSTDALIGVAITGALIWAFWALPLTVLLPTTVIGGYLAGHLAANLGVFYGLLYAASPWLGKILRSKAVDLLKESFGLDLYDDINDFYGIAGEWIAGILGFDSPLDAEIYDPLVLDLDGDGIELSTLAGNEVYFDYDGDGFAERTGWVSADDGLLAIDLNENGVVDGIGELFGSAVQDGFAVLETFDTNGDGIIDDSDEAFGQLRVWRDLNQNGVSDSGELMSLDEAGIVSISLLAAEINGTNNGHMVSREAIFSRP